MQLPNCKNVIFESSKTSVCLLLGGGGWSTVCTGPWRFGGLGPPLKQSVAGLSGLAASVPSVPDQRYYRDDAWRRGPGLAPGTGYFLAPLSLCGVGGVGPEGGWALWAMDPLDWGNLGLIRGRGRHAYVSPVGGSIRCPQPTLLPYTTIYLGYGSRRLGRWGGGAYLLI